jgi:very-short-patch-repair endonuclease
MDGDTHAEQKSYDELRTQKLACYGITVIRYHNPDVLNNTEGVYEDFKNKLVQLKESICL